VVLAARGDHAAFEMLVRRRQGALRQLMRRVCGDPALADDLAQQAFLQAWLQLSTLREPAAFGGWLRRLAVNGALQHLRKRGEWTDPEAGADLAAPEADPAAAMDVERLLQRLSPQERLCIVMCHAEGYSHGEVAMLTGLPLGTVKSHVSRGSRRMREWLGEAPEEAA
jgi:RNA polymerase sigma-70 factor (ECF subfamily)